MTSTSKGLAGLILAGLFAAGAALAQAPSSDETPLRDGVNRIAMDIPGDQLLLTVRGSRITKAEHQSADGSPAVPLKLMDTPPSASMECKLPDTWVCWEDHEQAQSICICRAPSFGFKGTPMTLVN